jgi:hypothetical protein
MTFPFGQGCFNLLANGRDRAALPFEQAEPVPQTNDFPLFFGIHDVHSGFRPM